MEEKKEKKWKNFKFEIFGTEWCVKFVNKVTPPNCDEDRFIYGWANSIKNEVFIALEDCEGNPLKDSTVKITLLHELVHCIFGTGNYNASNDDEPLVEWTARCISSLMKQGVLDYARPEKK